MGNDLEHNLPYQLLRLDLSCNANCLFCNVPRENGPERKLALAEIKSMIRKLKQDNPILKLSISGGEPTLRPDIAEIIAYAKRQGTDILEIQTNAIVLSEMEKVAALKAAGLDKAFVALHSHQASIHDGLVGRQGSHRKTVAGIRNLIANGVEVNVNPVITSYNYRDFPAFISFVAQELPEVKSISLSVVQPRGRVRSALGLLPGYKKISPFIEQGLDRADALGICVNNPYCGLPLCVGGWHKRLDRCVEASALILQKEIGRKADKVKMMFCEKCKMNTFCPGVWREVAGIKLITDGLEPVIG